MKRIVVIGFLMTSVAAADAPCEQVFSARYTWGAEVNVVQPCGGKDTYWVSANSWVLGPLVEYYTANTSKPYDAVYIRFRGLRLNEVVDGFAADYDGLMHISEVLTLDRKVPENCR